MEFQNCGTKLESILSSFLSKGEILSQEQKENLAVQYQEIWLDYVAENGFTVETMHYLHQSKNITEENFLYLYIKEFNPSGAQLSNALQTLYENKSYKEKWFDIVLELLTLCLNEGNRNTEYIAVLVRYLPWFRKNLKKKLSEESIKNYLLEILQPEVDLKLISLLSEDNTVNIEFYTFLSECLQTVKIENLEENCKHNYTKLIEYLVYVTQNESNIVIQNDTIKEIKGMKENKSKKQVTGQDVNDFMVDWMLLKELLGHVDTTFVTCIEDKIGKMIEENHKLRKENHSLNNEKNEIKRKLKATQNKANEEANAKEYANNALVDEQKRSSRLQKQLDEEQNSKKYYLSQSEQLKKQLETVNKDIFLQEQKIGGLEEYIETIKLESNKDLEGMLNNIASKVKREYEKFMEYEELKKTENDLMTEESILYLEHLLNRTFSILEKNGIHVK